VSHFNVSLIVTDKVTRQCPQTHRRAESVCGGYIFAGRMQPRRAESVSGGYIFAGRMQPRRAVYVAKRHIVRDHATTIPLVPAVGTLTTLTVQLSENTVFSRGP